MAFVYLNDCTGRVGRIPSFEGRKISDYVDPSIRRGWYVILGEMVKVTTRYWRFPASRTGQPMNKRSNFGPIGFYFRRRFHPLKLRLAGAFVRCIMQGFRVNSVLPVALLQAVWLKYSARRTKTPIRLRSDGDRFPPARGACNVDEINRFPYSRH